MAKQIDWPRSYDDHPTLYRPVGTRVALYFFTTWSVYLGRSPIGRWIELDYYLSIQQPTSKRLF